MQFLQLLRGLGLGSFVRIGVVQDVEDGTCLVARLGLVDSQIREFLIGRCTANDGDFVGRRIQLDFNVSILQCKLCAYSQVGIAVGFPDDVAHSGGVLYALKHEFAVLNDGSLKRINFKHTVDNRQDNSIAILGTCGRTGHLVPALFASSHAKQKSQRSERK